MSGCDNQKETEVTYTCSKYGLRLAPALASCKDPKLYCKYRTSCLIHFLEKQRRAPGSRPAADPQTA
jgi:hypothetical protein